jgi:hypothetical protein
MACSILQVPLSGGGSSDHHTLTNLTTFDDHPQYLFLAGRAGGQVAIGGTAASNNLTLQSTSNATRGKIIIGTSAYDEAGNLLGIGLSSPASALHVDKGNATASALQFTAGTTTGQTSTDGFHIGVTTTGLAEINQRENLAISIKNNNIETVRLTASNRVVLGSDLLGIGQLVIDRAIDVASGLEIGITLLPTISDSLGAGVYYGMAIQPNITGTNKMSDAYGAFFSITSDQTGGAGGVLGGAIFNVQATGDDYEELYGVQAVCDGQVTSVAASASFAEPLNADSNKRYALRIQGTYGAWEFEDSTTGTINSYNLTSSYIIFTGGSSVTLNGVGGGITGKRALFKFTNGATITHNSGSAAAGEKIFVSTGANITITGDGSVEMVWSEFNNRWDVISSQL